MTDFFLVDFGVDTSGIFHLTTKQDMLVFALNALFVVAVAFAMAAAMLVF